MTNKGPYVTSSTGRKDYLYFSHLMIDDNKTGVFNYYDVATKKWVTNTKDLSNIQKQKDTMYYSRQMAQMWGQEHNIGWALRIGTLTLIVHTCTLLAGVCIM